MHGGPGSQIRFHRYGRVAHATARGHILPLSRSGMMIMLLVAMLLVLGSAIVAVAAAASLIGSVDGSIDCWADAVQGEDAGAA
jgi:hypothetical protein